MIKHGLMQLTDFVCSSFDSLQEGTETLVAVFPFYHVAGAICLLFNGLYQGATLILFPTFDFEMFLQANHKYRVGDIVVN